MRPQFSRGRSVNGDFGLVSSVVIRTGPYYRFGESLPMSPDALSDLPESPSLDPSRPDDEPAVTSKVVADVEKLNSLLQQAKEDIGRVIFGQEGVIELAIITLLAGGHALLIGVPGLAKTKLVQCLGTVFGLDAKRVQFTPDLMPADILGSEVLEQSSSGERCFRFIAGPVFCQLLMADEINRASPRTQSALLQAMQEHRVSIAGQDHALPRPFHVLATQNPLEQEGTYPLPEAQLDRFLLQIDVGYPDLAAERRLLLATTGTQEPQPSPVFDQASLLETQQMVRRLPVGDRVVDAILRLVRAGRPADSPIEAVRRHVAWGPGPRAAQALMLCCRARALLDGRLTPSIDDIAVLARPVLQHRMALSFTAHAEAIHLSDILDRLTESIL
jgi:MoxR-like ATPase